MKPLLTDVHYKEIPFNPEWANGTDYYDHAVDDSSIELEMGETGHCKDEHGREIWINKTPYGNVAIFQRYTDGDTLVSNTPRVLAGNPYFSRDTSNDDAFLILGDGKGSPTLGSVPFNSDKGGQVEQYMATVDESDFDTSVSKRKPMPIMTAMINMAAGYIPK